MSLRIAVTTDLELLGTRLKILIPERFRPSIRGILGQKFPNSGIFLTSVDLFL